MLLIFWMFSHNDSPESNCKVILQSLLSFLSQLYHSPMKSLVRHYVASFKSSSSVGGRHWVHFDAIFWLSLKRDLSPLAALVRIVIIYRELRIYSGLIYSRRVSPMEHKELLVWDSGKFSSVSFISTLLFLNYGCDVASYASIQTLTTATHRRCKI